METTLRWAIHQLHPLPRYVSGHVALLGDAAHAMTPHQGAGAGQSIEVSLLASKTEYNTFKSHSFKDAYILAGILSHRSVTLENLPEALKAYEHVRLPFVNDIVERSRNAGALYELRSVHGDNYTTLGQAIDNQWPWVESEDPAAQLERALDWMMNHGRM